MFVKKQLTSLEAVLFWRMNVPDQRHALNVAYTAGRLAENQPLDRCVLIKAALLHDVGKERGDVSTWDKIITVLADAALPAQARRWGRLGRGGKLDNLRHAFYIYFHHAARSAALLEETGTDFAVIELVRRHHEAPLEHDPPELQLLRAADQRN